MPLLRRRPAVLLLALAALAALAPASSAAQDGADPLLASERGSGSRWTAATVLSDGGRVTSRLDVSGATSPLALSARLYVDGQRTSTTNVVLRAAGGGQGARVEAPDVAGLRLSVDQSRDDSGFRLSDVSLTLEANPDGPAHRGRLTLLLYAATAEVDRWRWSLRGAPGTSVLGTGTGPEAFAFSARDFGGSNVSVYAAEAVPGVVVASARSNTGASRTISLHPGFMGSYSTVGTDRLAVRGPLGYSRDCTPSCGFEPETATRLRYSGQHVFSLDGSSVGVNGPGGVSVADTDVSLHGALPRPPHGSGF